MVPDTVAEIIKNWDDGNNEIFDFSLDLEQVELFSYSKRAEWIG